jgi:HPt (histidine-containing phosphotransfer) domain-containing protein
MTETVIDLAVFRALTETAGADFVAELVGTFFEEAPAMLADLRSARDAADADRFRRAAHSLKSNSMTFGATALGTMARELELRGMDAEPARDAAAIADLEAAYERAAAALKELAHG